MQNVAVLYLDEADRQAWEGSLPALPQAAAIMAGDDPSGALNHLRGLGEKLRVVALSSRLYPRLHPKLVGLLREAHPEVEVLLLSPDGSAPPLRTLFEDRVRHLVVRPGQVPSRCDYLPAVLEMLVERRPWDVSSCLKTGTPVHSRRLNSSDEKEAVIRELERLLSGDGEEMELLRQKGALLADELLENAMYDAPRSGRGDRLFSKGERRSMLPQERIVFSFGFDGENLALALTDNWGSLDPDTVLDYLSRNEEEALTSDDPGGRGLFIIWRFLDRFHVAVAPGRRTTVGGHLQLGSKLAPEAPRGFHIMNAGEEIAA